MAALFLHTPPARKWIGAIAVLVLHGALIAMLLHATFAPRIRASVQSETILLLHPPRKVAPTMPAPVKRAGAAKTRYRDWRGFILPPGTQDEHRLAPFALRRLPSECWPENLSKLSPEQRAQCPSASAQMMPDDSIDLTGHPDRSRAGSLWARGRARKNAPLLLPCASPNGIGVGIGTILCLGKGIFKGFDLDAQPGYADKPENIHVPNGGDPPPIYVDPDH